MGRWTRGLILGRGSSATVSLATMASGELLAVKSSELSSSSLLRKERDLISQLSSPYIVKYLGSDITCENNKPMYNLLMEYFPGGTLSDQIKKQGGSLEEPMIQKYAYQILQGLDYLHSNGIVHCDIKSWNVLIGKDGAKIGDFGCAKKVGEGNGLAGKSTISGTPLFMAPEVARGEEQGFAADIWALGCIVVEMATGNSPWPNMNDPVSALYKIGYSGEVPECPMWLSNSAKDFLSKCLTRDAKERWMAKQLLQHPFFDRMERDKDMEFIWNSPTSVLDAFWDSMEVPEFPEDSSNIAFSLGSPANRIKNLIGDTSSSNSKFCSWTNDEEWITVRGSDTEEIPQISQQNHDSDQDPELAMEPILFPFSSEQSIDNSLIFNCFDDGIVSITSVSAGTNLTVTFGRVKDAFEFVLDILYFEIEIMKILLLFIAESLKVVFLCYFVLTCLIPLIFTKLQRQNFPSDPQVKLGDDNARTFVLVLGTLSFPSTNHHKSRYGESNLF